MSIQLVEARENKSGDTYSAAEAFRLTFLGNGTRGLRRLMESPVQILVVDQSAVDSLATQMQVNSVPLRLIRDTINYYAFRDVQVCAVKKGRLVIPFQAADESESILFRKYYENTVSEVIAGRLVIPPYEI